jgi:hypothetical protein
MLRCSLQGVRPRLGQAGEAGGGPVGAGAAARAAANANQGLPPSVLRALPVLIYESSRKWRLSCCPRHVVP